MHANVKRDLARLGQDMGSLRRRRIAPAGAASAAVAVTSQSSAVSIGHASPKETEHGPAIRLRDEIGVAPSWRQRGRRPPTRSRVARHRLQARRIGGDSIHSAGVRRQTSQLSLTKLLNARREPFVSVRSQISPQQYSPANIMMSEENYSSERRIRIRVSSTNVFMS
jgi:hypothetical protein